MLRAPTISAEANEEAWAESLRVYNSAEEIFADPNIDVVIIATPDSHKDYILGALARTNTWSAKTSGIELGGSSGSDGSGKTLSGTFTIHQNRRWDKDFQTAKTIIETDAIGRPYFVESR